MASMGIGLRGFSQKPAKEDPAHNKGSLINNNNNNDNNAYILLS